MPLNGEPVNIAQGDYKYERIKPEPYWWGKCNRCGRDDFKEPSRKELAAAISLHIGLEHSGALHYREEENSAEPRPGDVSPF